MLLHSAYIDARYNKDFQVSEEQLWRLEQKVKQLHLLVEQLCTQKIAEFGREIGIDKA